MKFFVLPILMFATLGASGAENHSAGLKFLEQATKQMSLKPAAVRPIEPSSCKRQGAQCVFHYECCSNFCGRGEC